MPPPRIIFHRNSDKRLTPKFVLHHANYGADHKGTSWSRTNLQAECNRPLLLTEEFEVSPPGEAEKANESVLEDINPNRNGELFKGFSEQSSRAKNGVRARIQINVRRSIREGSQGLLVSDQVTTDDDAIDVHSNR